MTQKPAAPACATNWARELRQGLLTGEALARHGFIDEPTKEHAQEIARTLDIRVPHSFQSACADDRHSDRARQVLPDLRELTFLPEELDDPIGDESHTPVEGLTYRYTDRALLKVTYLCAMYCRFCFRRHKVSHKEENPPLESLEAAIDAIAREPRIWEVILTGGDPLVLTDQKIEHILSRLVAIRHVKVIRFHTRIVSALPSRVTPALVRLLSTLGKPVWIVVHVNAASELTPSTRESLSSLASAGIPLLSQSVLLRGVNDTPEKLEALFRALVELRVKPYYLHYPDLARGTNHFRVELGDAIELFEGLRGRLSGICQPALVIDIPGGLGKIPAIRAGFGARTRTLGNFSVP